MPHLRLVPALAAILLALAGAPSAHAGQYTLAYDFGGDLSGWSGYVEPGYLLCGRGATAGCPDVSTNRILARAGAAQAVWSQGRWEWTAPPGTTIVGGALAYRTRMRHPQFYARVKMRADGMDWEAAPALLAEQQTTALTDHVVALAGGFRQVGVSLYAHPAAAVVTDAWDDYVTLVRLDVTVDDPTPPGLSWVDGGGLLDGGWHRDDVCATLSAADAQSGVNAVWLASGALSSVWIAPRTGSQYQPGIAGAQPGLCLSAAALGDGVHSGTAGANDVSGGRAADLPFTVHIDATPPVARLVAPLGETGDVRPLIELDIGDNLSGVLSVSAQIDATPVPIEFAGGRASGRPAAALAYGPHSLVWTISDGAGNRSSGSARFVVPAPAPPVVAPPQAEPPSAGATPVASPPAVGAVAVVPPPAARGKVKRTRAAPVRAITARFGATRSRVVLVHLRARARLRIVVRVRCGMAVRTLRVRANARGIATVRVACAGAATVRMVARPGRLLVHIAARRLPLRLQVRPARRSAPTVARVSGRLAEARGQVVVLEALTAGGWRRVGQPRADASGRFAASFAIVHAGQFALRGRVPALAGVASAPFVLTMR